VKEPRETQKKKNIQNPARFSTHEIFSPDTISLCRPTGES
jgi:hypothetical protein